MKQLKSSNNNGFSVFEALTIAVIVGVLVAIVVPNFITIKDNATESQLEGNARTLRIMLETYRVDHKIYPDNLTQLGVVSTQKGYNRELQNPFSNARGFVETNTWAIDHLGPNPGKVHMGKVAYQPTQAGAKYFIFAYDKEGKYLKRSGKPFIMTNG